MTTKLVRISELSKEKPDMKFNSIGHLINFDMLVACHNKMDGNKAVGIDGISEADYANNLEENLRGLVQRLKDKSYRPKPARKVEIPKDNGKTVSTHTRTNLYRKLSRRCWKQCLSLTSMKICVVSDQTEAAMEQYAN